MTGSKSTSFTFEIFSAIARGNDDIPSKLTIQKHPTTARGRFEFRGVFRAPIENVHVTIAMRGPIDTKKKPLRWSSLDTRIT